MSSSGGVFGNEMNPILKKIWSNINYSKIAIQ